MITLSVGIRDKDSGKAKERLRSEKIHKPASLARSVMPKSATARSRWER